MRHIISLLGWLVLSPFIAIFFLVIFGAILVGFADEMFEQEMENERL